MSLKTLLEWLEVAKNLGKEGKAAVKFAEAERNLEIEQQEKEAQRELERAKIAAETEWARIAAEANIAKIAADKEIQLAKIQMTASRDDALSASSNTPLTELTQ